MPIDTTENVDINNVDIGLRKGTSEHQPTSPNALRTTENRCQGTPTRPVWVARHKVMAGYHVLSGDISADFFRRLRIRERAV